MMITIIIFIVSLNQIGGQQHQSGTIIKIQAQTGHLLETGDIAGRNEEVSVIFTRQFTEVPQLFICPYKFSFNQFTSNISGYQLFITSTTTSGFTIRIIAPSDVHVYTVLLSWLAFVDAKKQVIRDKLISPTATSTRTYITNNLNFIQAIPALYSFVFQNPQYSFKLEVQSLDKSQVIILIEQVKIQEIEFQILLAEANSIWLYGTSYWSQNIELHPLTVSAVALPQDYCQSIYGFIITKQLQASTDKNFRWISTITQLDTSLSFTISAWDETSFIDGTFDVLLVSTSFQIFPLTLTYFDQHEYQLDVIINPITISFPQISTTYTSSSSQIEISNMATGLIMKISMQCNYLYKHIYQFQGTFRNFQNYISDKNFCLKGLNMVEYNLNFNDRTRMDYKRIQLTITEKSIEVIQKLHNEKLNELYTLVKIESVKMI